MFRLFFFLQLFVLAVNSDLLIQERNRGATLKPISACCEIPELGDSKPLAECSNPKLPGPCKDVQCVFEKSGFLSDYKTLNKEVYRNHLRVWGERNKGWEAAIDKAIKDCVDRDLRQYLDYPCRAYDVFTCTGIAMLKRYNKDLNKINQSWKEACLCCLKIIFARAFLDCCAISYRIDETKSTNCSDTKQ